jgi:superfamily II DNA helicase RecQ
MKGNKRSPQEVAKDTQHRIDLFKAMVTYCEATSCRRCVLLHCCFTLVTLLFHSCYTVVTLLLHSCYTVVTLLLHTCCTRGLLLKYFGETLAASLKRCCDYCANPTQCRQVSLQFRNTVVTLSSHCRHTVVTLSSHCCHTVVTLSSQDLQDARVQGTTRRTLGTVPSKNVFVPYKDREFLSRSQQRRHGYTGEVYSPYAQFNLRALDSMYAEIMTTAHKTIRV